MSLSFFVCLAGAAECQALFPFPSHLLRKAADHSAASSRIDSSELSSAFDSSEAASVSSKAAVSSQKEESVSETTAEKPSSMATTSVPAPVYSAPKPVSGETKAVWVSQFDLQNVLKTNGAQRDRETFTALVRPDDGQYQVLWV